MSAKIRNIFLDRDGTLIEDLHYLFDPDQVSLLPGVGPGLQTLQADNCRLFLVSNQSGIGRGYFTTRDYKACQQKLRALLQNYGVTLTDQAYCPHTPQDNCPCRKPRSGQWAKLAATHNLKPEESIIIGDKSSDIEFARNCNFKAAILVLSGKGKEEAQKMGLGIAQDSFKELTNTKNHLYPDVLAKDFQAACNWILLYNSRNNDNHSSRT